MSRPPSNPATRLGRYEILGRIASGGMATVYLARLADAAGGFAREFALKVIHPHLVEEEGFRERLLHEAKLASRVRHPNVVRTVDAGEDLGYAFMALELIDGVNLRELALHRARPFSPAQAAMIVGMVARGLHAVHTATDAEGEPLSMVHRDISPHNVMLDRSGRAILIDLGLAKADRKTGLTQVGVLAGKLPYMSPEQARVEPLDARSDLFAMGTLLFELATGDLPFGDTHSAKTLTRLERCDPAELTAAMQDKHLPAWLIDVVLTCLRADPAARLDSAAALADALSQELSVAQQDEANLRRALASIVEDALGALGPVEPAEPLALISSAVTAVENQVISPRGALDSRRGSALTWALLGAAAVLLLGVGAWALRGPPTLASEDSPRSEAAGSLSEDRSPPPQREEGHASPAKPKAPSSSPPPPAPPATDAPPAAEPVEAEKARPTRPVRRPRPPAGADELKPNPYAR